jgi:hypothetical protein
MPDRGTGALVSALALERGLSVRHFAARERTKRWSLNFYRSIAKARAAPSALVAQKQRRILIFPGH